MNVHFYKRHAKTIIDHPVCMVRTRNTGVVTISFLVHLTLPRHRHTCQLHVGTFLGPLSRRTIQEEGGSKRVSMPYCAPFRGSPSKSQDPSQDAFELPRKATGQCTHCSILSPVGLIASPGPFSNRDTRYVPALRGSRRRLCNQCTIFCQRLEGNRIPRTSE